MTFSKAASSSNYLAVRPDWLAHGVEEALEPDLPIIDAHHHLWDRPNWRYLFDEYLADVAASGHSVTASVFVQCQAMYRADGPAAMRVVGETEFVNGVAAMSAGGQYGPHRLCAGIVGHADLRLGDDVAGVLEAHIAAAPERFRGIRHITVWDADRNLMNPLSAGPPGLLADGAFRAGFARLAPLGLAFDAWLFHPQIPELTELARAFPQTRIVLDHLGGIVGIGPYKDRRDEIFATWSRAIRELAACENACVKLGGLGMRINGFGFETREVPPSSEILAAASRPYIETCIEAFGAGRCMFESNFPVDKGSYGYGTVWNAFKRLTRGASESDRTSLLSGTAARVYGLARSG
ncbi:amidohydrolase family protein [Bradyrhizobium stylosanthis]|uniref:Putative TIM-barrel fold metal-dependent hydrolase n=1 Tax=Bradyrhizobium stylosanthis TaxID=1803665 RepID=A0A560DQY8_9BRAD|nr:amidohydrolase family protein [Bradyrhizobium stylosanthis]TWA99452.1 putative TIM-barrel fold metal-dependent hydrolase [Bradyrhizobium stylosanthis]